MCVCATKARGKCANTYMLARTLHKRTLLSTQCAYQLVLYWLHKIPLLATSIAVEHVKRHRSWGHNERILITTTYHTVTFNFNIYHEFTAHVSYVTDDNVLIPYFIWKMALAHTRTHYTGMCMCIKYTLMFMNIVAKPSFYYSHCYNNNALHWFSFSFLLVSHNPEIVQAFCFVLFCFINTILVLHLHFHLNKWIQNKMAMRRREIAVEFLDNLPTTTITIYF